MISINEERLRLWAGELCHVYTDSERYTMSTRRTLVRRRSFLIPASTKGVGVVLSPVP